MTPPEISRRTLLELLAGAGVLVTVSGCSGDTASDGPVEVPPVSDASDGTPVATVGDEAAPATAGDGEVRPLRLRLWAEPTTAEIVAGVTTRVSSFGAEVLDGDPASVTASGSYLGPTLRLRTGQRVQVEFENRLDDECIVHWHGLVVPQDQDGQPAEAVAPGAVYNYDFTVTNDPGTYWYHPHPHGRTGEQVYRGLAGMIVVADTDGNLPNGDNDLALVLQDRTIGSDGELRYATTRRDTMAGFVGDTPVTNGVADFEMAVRREPYRIRLLNGANSQTQYLTWSNGAAVHVVATDGNLLPETVSVDGVVITPAQRSDLWIDFSTFEPGQRVQLLAADAFVESGNPSSLTLDAKTAATFVIEDTDPMPGALPTTLGRPPVFGPDDAVNRDAPKQFILSTRRAAHWINDTQWEGRVAVDVETVKANTVELWEFVNQSPMAHPMHLHGEAFRIVSRTWDDDRLADAWATISHGVIDTGLRDTVLVWPGQRVQIAARFADHLGYFLYHCHILEHEDAGMMRNFLVT